MPQGDQLALALAIVLPFLGGLACRLLPKQYRENSPAISIVSTAATLLLLFGIALVNTRMGFTTLEVAWVPSLGLNFSIFLDGLGLFFASLTCLSVLMITFYASSIAESDSDGAADLFTFLQVTAGCYLLAFLSDNLLLTIIALQVGGLVVFFRLTAEENAPLQRLHQCLVWQAIASALFFAGLLLMVLPASDQSGNPFSLLTLLQTNLDELQLYGPWVIGGGMLLLAASLYSALTPAHGWLLSAAPGRFSLLAFLTVGGPTLVGPYLVCRWISLSPDNTGSLLVYFLMGFLGALTAIYAGIQALRCRQLQPALIWSATSSMGALFLHYGLGAIIGLTTDYALLLNFTLGYGALFLVGGTLVAWTGSDDLDELHHTKGIWKLAPLVSIPALIACLSLAGVPGTLGWLALAESSTAAMGLLDPANEPMMARTAQTGIVLLSAMGVFYLLRAVFVIKLFWQIFIDAPELEDSSRPSSTALSVPSSVKSSPALSLQAPNLPQSMTAVPGLLALVLVVLGVLNGGIVSTFGVLRDAGVHQLPLAPMAYLPGSTDLLLFLGLMLLASLIGAFLLSRNGWKLPLFFANEPALPEGNLIRRAEGFMNRAGSMMDQIALLKLQNSSGRVAATLVALTAGSLCLLILGDFHYLSSIWENAPESNQLKSGIAIFIIASLLGFIFSPSLKGRHWALHVVVISMAVYLLISGMVLPALILPLILTLTFDGRHLNDWVEKPEPEESPRFHILHFILSLLIGVIVFTTVLIYPSPHLSEQEVQYGSSIIMEASGGVLPGLFTLNQFRPFELILTLVFIIALLQVSGIKSTSSRERHLKEEDPL